MATKQFKKQDLKELVSAGDVEDLEVMSDTIIGKGRWNYHKRLVFRETSTDKYYESLYFVGATEQQEERPFDCEDDLVECHEVQPSIQTVTVYRRV